MGELWRSEEMQLVQLFVQIDTAHDTVDELGKIGLIQFRDLNPEVTPFQRNFVNEVKRGDEMERRLRFFMEQITLDAQELENMKEHNPTLQVVELEEEVEEQPKKELKDINDLETHLEDLEKDVNQMNAHRSTLEKNYNELIELSHVLTKDASFFDETVDVEKLNGTDAEELQSAKPLVEKQEIVATVTKLVKVGFVTGVVLRDKFTPFEKTLWRVLRGNLYMKHAEIEAKIKDPGSGEYVEKNVFIVFFQGDRSQTKIKKICESFGANLYSLPNTAAERADMAGQVTSRLEDLHKVIRKTNTHRRGVLANIQKQYPAWNEKVLKEKSIWATMNLFNYDIGRKLLIAEGWCPKTSTEDIVKAMKIATEKNGGTIPSVLSVVDTHEEPPTHFKTNKFTSSYLAIVEAYGVAQYGEVNPAAITIITFPFLFAVMFGDFGHGLLMTIFASFLIYKEKQFSGIQLNEMIKTCFDGRYVLILMGLFSMYTGLLYNECFSVPIDLCGSMWSYPAPKSSDALWYAVRTDSSRTYEFGVDPAWQTSENVLNYYNSLKMKMSVIMGIVQMSLGIFLSCLNGIYFRKPVNIFCEFVPQILFLLSIFGYMCFLIFYKWSVDWVALKLQPPFLLNVMIQMFLSPISVTPDNQVFSGQLQVQWALIIIAVVCIPWMLVLKPYILKYQYKKKTAKLAATSTDETPVEKKVESHDGGHDEEEGENGEFDFGEIFIKQIIHTIEFVLGAISNTASYLRLWALSLAHSELAGVFWDRAFILTYETGGFYLVFFGFAIWAGLTFGVLMVMESLSAFLHALRLHWVEFQNKFYHGDGYKFMPFSYARLLSGEEEN